MVAAILGVAALVAPRPAAAASHTITWDACSLMIDGQRTFIWSGELHPFRLPSPSLWRDVLQKLKANGYNAVSIYFDPAWIAEPGCAATAGGTHTYRL